jgi:hypothetical protein
LAGEHQFLPVIYTSLLQPLDQGIAQNAKVHFRKHLVQRMLINIQKKLSTEITALQGLQMITGRWWNVNRQRIRDCWRKSGILCSFQEYVTGASSNVGTSCEMLDVLAGRVKLPVSLTFDERVSAKKEKETVEIIMYDVAIVESVSSPPEGDDEPN